MKNRYTIQIIGTLDTDDKFQIQQNIFNALDAVDGLTVKAVTVDLWCDMNGTVRTWDDDGNETTEGYMMTPVQAQDIQSTVVDKTQDKLEDVTNAPIEEISEEK